MSNLLTTDEIKALAGDTETILTASGYDGATIIAKWLTNEATSRGLVFRGMTAEYLASVLAQPDVTPMDDDDDGAAQSDYVPMWSVTGLRSALREGR